VRSALAGLRTLNLPWGASVNSPHIAIGPDIPTALATFSPNLTLYAAAIYYYDATHYYFTGMGLFYAQQVYVEGTYDPTNGVYITRRVLEPTAGTLDQRIGSYLFDAFQQTYTFQQTNVRIGDGSNISDQLTVNGVHISNAIDFNANGSGTAETWHALAYINGWANNGGANVTGQYRLVAAPARCVQVVGAFTPGTKVNGTALTNALPAAYRPTHAIDVPVNVDITAAVGGQSPHFNISTGGVFSCFGVTAATFVSVNAIYPLDA
jgi:hypothetical protein